MAKEINVHEHIFVPKHEKLSDQEKKEVLEMYNVSPKQLPRINSKDPAIKDLDIKAGDIIKVTRKSQTAGESFYYRVVVE